MSKPETSLDTAGNSAGVDKTTGQPNLRVEGGRLFVAGPLRVDTVAGYKDAGIVLIDTLEAPVLIDLVDADVQGSAAIALLIAWQRHLVQKQSVAPQGEAGESTPLRLLNASPRLREIASACGVEDILPFADA
jgi:ABC-type transporter Mla MlaB component